MSYEGLSRLSEALLAVGCLGLGCLFAADAVVEVSWGAGPPGQRGLSALVRFGGGALMLGFGFALLVAARSVG